MNDGRRNGMRNLRRSRRRIEVWTTTVVAVQMNAMISTEQRTVIKVEVPMTTPVAPMGKGLGSSSTNLNRRA
jgi:homoserine kinase